MKQVHEGPVGAPQRQNLQCKAQDFCSKCQKYTRDSDWDVFEKPPLRLIKALDAKKRDSPHQHWSWLLQLWSSWSKKFEFARCCELWDLRCFDCLASQDLCVLLPRSLREADLKIAKLTRVLMETLYKNLVTNPGSWNSAAGRLRGDRAAYHSTSN